MQAKRRWSSTRIVFWWWNQTSTVVCRDKRCWRLMLNGPHLGIHGLTVLRINFIFFLTVSRQSVWSGSLCWAGSQTHRVHRVKSRRGLKTQTR